MKTRKRQFKSKNTCEGLSIACLYKHQPLHPLLTRPEASQASLTCNLLSEAQNSR